MLQLLGALFIISFCGNSSATTCPKEWVDGTDKGMGCLLFNSTKAYHWDDAISYCQKDHEASLLQIITEDQMQFTQSTAIFLAAHEGNHHWWTSGTDVGLNGDWLWATSCSISGCLPVDTYVWGPSRPTTNIDPICQKI